ncbi:hybrid sensor histidine kinase/response regulator [Aliiglaciecola sp. CAU 1673]|uniref:ATP-binding response regulator n=1 Tax=Aliiglaciecola sp. CAU 1673 TaxID=3032595 RepID=UPI0023DA47A4|nr:hybrid sensor histidine kinase/response regulator [Aliiglaciecola sp. CAU 1673]MDF2180343.1 hybrid sensor histidine kinase/response regulator [Aliiglaciecola sp. CAU 1673]
MNALLRTLFANSAQPDPIMESRLDVLIKQTNLSGAVSFGAAIILMVLLQNQVNTTALLLWVATFALIPLFRVLFVYRSIQQRRAQGEKRYRLYHALIVFFLSLSGSTWGIGVYAFLPEPGATELFVTFFIFIFGITTGLLVALVYSLWGYLVFLLPMMLGTVLRLYEFEQYLLLTGTGLYSLYLTITAMRLSKVVTNAISIDVANANLLQQVTEEKIKAEQANAEKSRFLAAASHDLRQPLNAIGLFIQALSQRLTDKQHQDILSPLRQSFTALKGLLDTLLDLSRLDSGDLELDWQSVPLDSVMLPLLDEFKVKAEHKGLSIEYPSSAVVVRTDPMVLARLLRNLLDNAVKYTHEGGISIQISRQQDQLRLSIQDSGIGIPREELGKIFNEYHQIANKRRDARKGIGLGLSIVQKLAHLLGSEVEVESEPGKGSTFSLTLPVVESVIVVEEAPRIQGSRLFGVRVLIIDDDPNSLAALRLVLEGQQCHVICAQNDEQALSSLEQQRPDIILCDYRLMDDKTGVELIAQLRQALDEPVKAIILTGDTDPEIIQQIHAQQLPLLNKPVDLDALEQLIFDLLSE